MFSVDKSTFGAEGLREMIAAEFPKALALKGVKVKFNTNLISLTDEKCLISCYCHINPDDYEGIKESFKKLYEYFLLEYVKNSETKPAPNPVVSLSTLKDNMNIRKEYLSKNKVNLKFKDLVNRKLSVIDINDENSSIKPMVNWDEDSLKLSFMIVRDGLRFESERIQLKYQDSYDELNKDNESLIKALIDESIDLINGYLE